MTNQSDPSMEDSDLEEILNMEMQTLYSQVHHTGVRVQLTEQSKEKARELLKARDERREVESKIAAIKILAHNINIELSSTNKDFNYSYYIEKSDEYVAELEQSLTKKENK